VTDWNNAISKTSQISLDLYNLPHK